MKFDILSNCIVTIQIYKFLHIKYSSLNSIKTTIINIEYRIDYEFEYFYEVNLLDMVIRSYKKFIFMK